MAARDELSDDALISLSYGRTLGLHGWWGMQPGVEANSQTSPLNALLLGALTAATRSVIVAAGLIWVASIATIAGCVDFLADRLGLARWPGPVAGALVATSPVMVATIGLETALTVALVAVLACMAVVRGPLVVGALAGLVMLARPDAIAFTVAAIALCGARWWRAALAAAAVGTPWLMWSWWALGSVVPDTANKVGSGGWPEPLGIDGRQVMFTIWNGPLLYAYQHPTSALLIAGTIGVSAVGVVALVARRPGSARTAVLVILAGGGIGYHATMLVLDPQPFAWYYGPSLATWMLAGTVGLAAIEAAVLLAAAMVTAALAVTFTGPTPITPESGNFGTASQYAAVARELPGGPVEVLGEIGAITFYCDGRCLTVGNGFSERAVIAPELRQRADTARGLRGWLLRLNHAHLEVPPPIRAPVRVVNTPDIDTPAEMRHWPLRTVWRGPMRMVLLPGPPPS